VIHGRKSHILKMSSITIYTTDRNNSENNSSLLPDLIPVAAAEIRSLKYDYSDDCLKVFAD